MFCKLLKAFFINIKSWPLFYRLRKLGFCIKENFNKETRYSAVCKSLDELVKYKNKHPNDFDKFFEIFKEFLNDYEKSKK
ncbi:TPA: hypothetical protein RXM96_000230 [Campylobacter coli]|nr:hypothetical protein [Campylobacter coli]